MTQVVGYRRLSPSGSTTTAQRESKLDDQLDEIEKTCEAQDLELVEVFTDKRASGRKIYPYERDAWPEMMRYVAENDVDGIVVKDLSRWARRAEVAIGAVSFAKGCLWDPQEPKECPDLRLYSALDNESEENELIEFDMIQGNEAALFQRFMKAYKSQDEAGDTARKVQNALDKKLIKGKTPRGITTDKRIANEQEVDMGEASMWLPDEATAPQKRFSTCLHVLNEVDNSEKGKTEIGREMDFPEGSEWDTVNRIWQNRHKYAMAVMWHREVVERGESWYSNSENYDVNWDWLVPDNMTQLEVETVEFQLDDNNVPW